MKNNKYLIFASIGFELVGLILVAIYVGEYLSSQLSSAWFKAGLIILAFILWFYSLLKKLKSMEK